MDAIHYDRYRMSFVTISSKMQKHWILFGKLNLMCSFGMYVIQATRVSDASTKVAATATNFNAANFFILLIRPTA